MTNLESTLTQIVSIITAFGFLYYKIKQWAKDTDKEATKDFLVLEFARAERHELGVAEKIRLKERYDHYIKKPEDGGLGGNSYIKEEYEKLKEQDKL